ATRERNHIAVLKRDTRNRVENKIDKHVNAPRRDIDANRQWSQQNADTHSIAGRTISAHRAISRSTRPLAGANRASRPALPSSRARLRPDRRTTWRGAGKAAAGGAARRRSHVPSS